jgi:hypothetical protein
MVISSRFDFSTGRAYFGDLVVIWPVGLQPRKTSR